MSVFLWNKTTNIFSYDVLTVACGGVDRLIIFSANLDSVSSLQRWMRVREQGKHIRVHSQTSVT